MEFNQGYLMLCFLAIVACVFSQGPDNDLTRCNREFCPKPCKFGLQTDKDGCFICECLKNPCEGLPCQKGLCKPDPKCSSHPCTEIGHTCVDPLPCPVPMCADFCPHGLKTNEYGCETCQCKENACEDVTCPENQACSTVLRPEAGPMNQDGFTPVCAPVEQPPAGLTDILKGFDELPPLCLFRKTAFQMGRTEMLNHQELEEEQRVLRTADDVKCDANGEFVPRQCNKALGVCWCVTDAGRVVPNTVTKTTPSSSTPQCDSQTTMAVDVELVLKHRISINNMPAEEDISISLRAKLSQYMQLDEEQIEIREMNTGEEEITVSLTLHHDGKDGSKSVAYLSERLRWNLVTGKESLDVVVQQQTLTPVADRMTMQPRVEGGTPTTCFAVQKYWRKRPYLLAGAALLGLVALILVIIAITMACRGKKKGSANLNQYKENLQFSNEVYFKSSKPILDHDFLDIEGLPPKA